MKRMEAVPSGSGFAYATARDELVEQLGRIEALDTKAGILIAAGGVFAGLVFGSESFVGDAPAAVSFVVAILVVATLQRRF